MSCWSWCTLRRLHVVVLLLFSDLFHDNCNAFVTNLLQPTSPQAFRRQFHPSSHHIKRRCPSISPSAVEMTSTTEGGRPKTTTILSDSTSSRLKRTTDFLNWAMANDVKCAGVKISSNKDNNSGLGLFLTRSIKTNDIVIQVPSKLTLSVESPKDYNTVIEKELFLNCPKVYRNLPWWAALSVQLNYYDKVNPIMHQRGSTGGEGVDMSPWIQSLPRQYDTPIHWSESTIVNELQYRPTIDAVALQQRTWREQYDIIAASSSDFVSKVSYTDFIWGCETARSRAFSGGYSGSAFNPIPYVTVSILVAVYVSLNVGSWEQAANGAAMVVCGSILKDFVLPKLLKVQKYVICPVIDMANHVGVGASGIVSFEYFTDGFSLSATTTTSLSSEGPGSEMYIQYGPRSNDQLLQYYGFVEKDNVHDVYILPPIREWDIGAIEDACGRKVGPGRLEKLDRAGLLGGSRNNVDDTTPTTTTMNVDATASMNDIIRGVVLTRATGIDVAVIQAVRALISTNEEWQDAGEAIGNFAAEISVENERAARLAIRRVMEMELESKATTMEEDETLLKAFGGRNGGEANDVEEILAVKFRLEKKRLLQEAISNMLR